MPSPLLDGLLGPRDNPPYVQWLNVWFDASQISGSSNSSSVALGDGQKAARIHNFARPLNSATQGTDANRPTLDVDGSYAGKRTWVFDSNDNIDMPAGALGAFTELDVFLVGGLETLSAGNIKRFIGSWVSAPNLMFLLTKNASDKYQFNYSNNGTDIPTALISTETPVSDVDHIFNFYTTPTEVGFSVDSEAFITAAGKIYSGGASAITLGHAFTTQPIHISEVLVYTKKLSDTERAQVNEYLQDKWGFL